MPDACKRLEEYNALLSIPLTLKQIADVEMVQELEMGEYSSVANNSELKNALGITPKSDKLTYRVKVTKSEWRATVKSKHPLMGIRNITVTIGSDGKNRYHPRRLKKN